MIRIPLWFDRKFEFKFPVEQFPNLCIRLRGTPPRLEELMSGIPQHVLLATPEDKWSAQEHAGHLLDMEPLWSARVHDFFGAAETLTVADLSNRKTHEADHNAKLLSEILAGFRAARVALANRLSASDDDAFSRSKLHPRLKQPMRLVDHLYFVAEHDDHHLARMWQLLH